jgi:hypothetical protein
MRVERRWDELVSRWQKGKLIMTPARTLGNRGTGRTPFI